ncbi:MAG: MATE family efflux transporter [Gammaproteobacteria bacterium]|nr:MATE family efflux transporter [Gammaproteobacteria bacterium]
MKHAYGNAAIWSIALPMIISTVSVPLLGLVDTAVLGHLDSPVYLAAVAVGATVFNVAFMTLNFLRMGTTGIAAQAFGAGEPQPVLSSLVQPLVIALLLAAVLLALQVPILSLALLLLQPDSVVSPYVSEYFSIRIWSAPAMLCNLVMVGWLLGMQNARATLAVYLLVNVSNMVLSVILVWGFGLDVRGVATGTLVAEYAGTLLALWHVLRELRLHGVDYSRQLSSTALTEVSRYMRLLRVNSSLFVRSLALMFVFAFITARGARLGADVLAINAVLLNFLYFFSYATDGLANAAEALTGKAVGRQNREGLRLAVRNTLRWTAGFTVVFALVYLLAGPVIIDLLTGIDRVRSGAREYLPWIVALPLVSAWCFLYDGVYVGMTRTREMMLVMAGSVLGVFLPVWFVLQASGYGNHALWAALIAFMAVRSAGMHLWCRSLVDVVAKV